MQSTAETPQSPFSAMDTNNTAFTTFIHRAMPWSGFPSSSSPMGSSGDPTGMEQLLLHCATAIETNDATLAQQILWVLNNIAPPDGDSNQRLAFAFLRALITRAAQSGSTCKLLPPPAALRPITTHMFSIIDLAAFVDLTPWHRFGFTAANAAILEAVRGFSVIHIVDLSSTHCMQIPTLIDAIANRRRDGPNPLVKLTVVDIALHIPPVLEISYQELAAKLVGFARSRNVVLEFRVIPSSYADGFSTLIEGLQALQHESLLEKRREGLVINCHMMLHYIPLEETDPNPIMTTYASEPLCSFDDLSSSLVHSFRTRFLRRLRSLEPLILVVVDEDADFTSNSLVGRLRSAFNYLWMPFDTIDTFPPKGSKQREWFEANLCWKIENVVAREGCGRVERQEPMSHWGQRMSAAGFRGVVFGEDAFGEVKSVLNEHAAGWGMKKEEDGLVLTWKGHNAVFASAWVPA